MIGAAQTKVTTPLDQLNNYLNVLKKDDDLVSASWGFCLMEPATGKILAEVDKKKSLMPASGMKVITTLSALNIIGENYMYTTLLEHDGKIDDSVLSSQ